MIQELIGRALVFGVALNLVEKKIFGKYLPSGITRRPQKAYSYFLPEDLQEEGFPSGHSQLACFLATYLTLSGKFKKYLVPIWVLTILICIQRITSQVHTGLQVVSGAVFGVIFALISGGNHMRLRISY